MHRFRRVLVGLDLDSNLEDDARERIAGDVAAAGTGLAPDVHVTCTSPIRAILGEVARADPDLLVMATVSRWGIAKRLVGSTAERALARETARCSP